jgi:hypothetical protein
LAQVIGQPRSTQRRVLVKPHDEERLTAAIIELATRLRKLWLPPDHSPAQSIRLAGEQEARGAHLAARGAEGAKTTTQEGPVLAQRWLLHPAQAGAAQSRLGL